MYDNKVILIRKEITRMKKIIKLIATAIESYGKSMEYYGRMRVKVWERR
jgi:hypothetical protein